MNRELMSFEQESYLLLGTAAIYLGTDYETMRQRVLRGQIPAMKDRLDNWRIDMRHVNQILSWQKPFGEVMRECEAEGTDPLSLYS